MTRPHPDPTRLYEQELDLDAAPEAVWRALTEGAELARWFAPEASVEPGPEGSVRWRWGELFDWPQTIEVWEPLRRLRTRYASTVEDGAGGQVPLFVDFQLEGHGGRTTLRLVHSGFGPEASFDREYDGISQGWSIELESLRLYLEQHPGRERQLVWCTHPVEDDLEAAWARLTGPEGLGCGTRVDALAPGAPVRVEVAGEAFEGQVLRCHPRELAVRATSHGDAFLRVTVEQCMDQPRAWLWLAGYGWPSGERERLEARFGEQLARTFAGRGETAGAGGA